MEYRLCSFVLGDCAYWILVIALKDDLIVNLMVIDVVRAWEITVK
jgi:hypothetical protein